MLLKKVVSRTVNTRISCRENLENGVGPVAAKRSQYRMNVLTLLNMMESRTVNTMRVYRTLSERMFEPAAVLTQST
jgi:hypothetical protein